MNSEKGKNGGKWSLQTHLKNYGPKTFNDGICNWIMVNIKPKSVIDFGCGVGYYSNYFSLAGADVVHAIEPEKMDSKLFNNERNCIQFELDITNQKIPEIIQNSKYDLVFSLEVLEHIERKYHDKIFDFLCEKSNQYIIFSGARIGQPGIGHISCRDELDWRNEFLKRGYVFENDLTNDIRKSSNIININHRKNLQVFIK